MGFRQVYRYTAGKKDWMANGLPVEGEEARAQRAADLARPGVPVCGPEEQVGEVNERVQKAGWEECVVVNGERVVMGLLRAEALQADPGRTAGQVMDPGVRTYRLDTALERPARHMQKAGVDSVLVTSTDGQLFGLLKREDVEKALAD